MRFLKWIIIYASIIIVSLSFKAYSSTDITPDERGYIVKIGDQAENFPITLIDGTEKFLSDFNAEVIILNFFASWCSVCRKEIPHIEKEIWQQFKDKDVVVLGVDYKENLEKVENFVKEINITYPVALDTAGTIFARFARGGVTRNVVLDKNLNIIYLTRLFDESEFEGMIKVIETKINQGDSNGIIKKD